MASVSGSEWRERNGINAGVWASIRPKVLSRDGGECQIRDVGCTGLATQVHHVVEPHRGGAKYDLGNLQASCASCNARGGGRLGNATTRTNAERRGYDRAMAAGGTQRPPFASLTPQERYEYGYTSRIW